VAPHGQHLARSMLCYDRLWLLLFIVGLLILRLVVISLKVAGNTLHLQTLLQIGNPNLCH